MAENSLIQRLFRPEEGLWLIIDRRNCACGITDRFKAAVGLYWIAKQNSLPFKFIHNAGFDIREYLVPNETDWSADISDISPLPWRRSTVRYLPPFDTVPVLSPGRQYVCRRFIGKNIIEMSGVPQWQRVWRESFRDLFSPSFKVRDAIAGHKMPSRYRVVNVRFINSLGWNEAVSVNSPLPADSRSRLLDAVLAKVAACEAESDSPVIVYSDRKDFLEAASRRGFNTCDPDGVGHIMNPGTGDYVNLMTFVFFYQMAGAEKIYSILNVEGFPPGCLYKSQYPRYAAILGDKPFVRI